MNWDKEKQEQINIIQRNYYKYKEIKNNQNTKNKKFLWIAKTKNNLRTLHEPNKSKKINKLQRTENFYGTQKPKKFL